MRAGKGASHRSKNRPPTSDLGLGCVKTLRGMTAPGILRLVVTFRAKKCRNLSSAQHYDQIRFRFYTAWVKNRMASDPRYVSFRRQRTSGGTGLPPRCAMYGGRPRCKGKESDLFAKRYGCSHVSGLQVQPLWLLALM